MAVTRPLKEGSVTTYQQKVALGFPDILASEMDADLDTIYAAWNGNVGTANLVDGSVTYAKLAPDAQLWRDTGTALTPGTSVATRVVNVPGSGSGAQALLASGEIVAQYPALASKAHIYQHTNANLYISTNLRLQGTPALDDAAQPSWVAQFGATGADTFQVRRAPVGSTTLTTMLLLDSTGNSYVLGNFSTGGVGTAYSAPGIRISGTGAGIRCQNTGTGMGDGYSNAIAFGWNGSQITCRVDTVDAGTVNRTPPSDMRDKAEIRDDDVPGLAAVCALRPVTFTYRQGERLAAFPEGRQYGLIAQEAQPHVPLVIQDDESEDHFLGLDYRLLVPVLIRAIQELAARVGAP
jgi:hypothetical protein